MPSVYPGALDSLSTTHADGVNEVIAAATTNDLADAVNKIEAELGVNPSGAEVTVLAALGLKANLAGPQTFAGTHTFPGLTFVASAVAAGGISFGGDTNLYRSAAGTLKTDGAFQAASYAVGTVPLASTHLSDGAELARVGGRADFARSVLDVGLVGQSRAGRVLTVADFTALGLGVPAGLFNLSGLTNLGSGGALVNKGAVPFDSGITGTAGEAARFAGSSAQALYIADTGAADPFRIKTGSWGCWFRTAKRGITEALLCKAKGVAAGQSWSLQVSPANVLRTYISTDGNAVTADLAGITDLRDDRWHQATVTYDGSVVRAYVDGALEASAAVAGTIFGSATPLNVGSDGGADATIASTNPHFGRVDEAFVTADVLSEDQIRLLYAVKIPHGLSTAIPRQTSLAVRRLRRGGPLAVADFPAQPVRLHNFTAGAVTDEGSGAVALTPNPGTGSIVDVAGVDGAAAGAKQLAGAHTGLSATDAGLPAALTTRSYGCWFKTAGATIVVMGWGTTGTADARLLVSSTGVMQASSSADTISGPVVNDGSWHHVVAVEDNAAGDGVKRKLYLDGRLVGVSLVLNTLTLIGANGFRVGANPNGTNPFVGTIDGAFVFAGALTPEQIAKLYARGSQDLGLSPKNAGDHVERIDATNVYFIGDTLKSQHQIELGVTA